ncbi:MAG: type I-MYXAN CRISPR-associated protein Cas6/Cmx6 [Polyangiaceae bacterium]|nr:type I-MYXAN CRISPR-associated protein Cas6/Cmx6 [Polyangiaceae bacterium]
MTDARQTESTSERSGIAPRFDVAFPVAGGPVPLDHGYALFSALTRALGDEVHGATWLAVHPLSGAPRSNGMLALRPRNCALRLRVDGEHIGRCVSLAAGTLNLGGTELLVGTSRVFTLRPARALVARIVTIKGFLEAEPFREALRRQLDALSIGSRVEIGRRRTVRVSGDVIVGFQVTLHDLDDPGSLRVQYAGLGGRQRMGCGVFTPLGGHP